MSNSLWPHGQQDARLPCPPPSPGVCSDSCPLSGWCHPDVSSSVSMPSPPALNLSQHQGLSQGLQVRLPCNGDILCAKLHATHIPHSIQLLGGLILLLKNWTRSVDLILVLRSEASPELSPQFLCVSGSVCCGGGGGLTFSRASLDLSSCLHWIGSLSDGLSVYTPVPKYRTRAITWLPQKWTLSGGRMVCGHRAASAVVLQGQEMFAFPGFKAFDWPVLGHFPLVLPPYRVERLFFSGCLLLFSPHPPSQSSK